MLSVLPQAGKEKSTQPLFVSEIVTSDIMKFQTGHRSAATGVQLTRDRHWLTPISLGHEIRAMQMEEVCKSKAGTEPAELWVTVLAAWVLAPVCLGTCGRDQIKQQSWLLHCMKIVLLAFRGFSSPGSSGDKVGFRLKRLKRGSCGRVAGSPQRQR